MCFVTSEGPGEVGLKEVQEARTRHPEARLEQSSQKWDLIHGYLNIMCHMKHLHQVDTAFLNEDNTLVFFFPRKNS